MKKTLYILLAAVLLATTMCASLAEGASPIVTEPLTLKVMFKIRDVDSLTDPASMPAVIRLEEQTGIHIEWEVIKGSDWKTKVNLMFASGDYPDIIISQQDNALTEEYGVTQKLLIPLDDELTSQYMPNYTSRRQMEYDDPTAGLTASDGHKYSIGYLVAQNINTNQHFFINKVWLDELGIPMPESLDELTDALRAFKAVDFNGDGIANEVPLQMGVDTGFNGIKYLLPMFGIPVAPNNWLYIDDDKQVQFSATQDGFRECMEWLNMLYEEELVDPEILSQDLNTIETKLKEGNVGFFTAWRLTAMGFDDGVMKNSVLYIPVAPEGYQASLYRYMEIASPGAFLTIANEHVPESLKWLDAILETETMYSLYYGEQDATDHTGWTYNKDNGKIDSINDGSVDVKNFLDCNTLFFAPGQYISTVFNMSPQRLEKTAYCVAYEEAGVMQKYSNDYMKLAPLTSEQLQTSALKETDINSAVVENIANFIVNGVTDSSWEAFLELFEKIGVDEYVQMYQNAIDSMDID